MNKPVIRCSSIPTLIKCPASVLNPDGLTVVETHNDAAELGTLIHAELERLVDTGETAMDALKQRLNDADHARACKLIDNFGPIWREARSHMTDPRTERSLRAETDSFILTGHIDLSSVESDRAFLIDYKTGRQHGDHYHQMAGYAFLLWDSAGKPEDYTVYASAVYLEDRSVHGHTFTPQGLRDWVAEVGAKVAGAGYAVGRHCAYCTIADSCPSYLTYARNSVAALAEATDDDKPVRWADLEPAERGALADSLYVVEKMVDRLKLSLRNTVKRSGSVDLGDGSQYQMVSQENRSVNLTRALPVLRERVGEGVIMEHASLSLEKVLHDYSKRAARGKKSQARRDLAEELEKAGAIERRATERMYRRPRGEVELDIKE